MLLLLGPHGDWALGLETTIKLGLRVSDPEKRSEILETVVNSAEKLASQETLKKALECLLKFLAKDASLCKWSTDQCGYVVEFAFAIAGIGEQETAEKISQMVTKHDYGLGQYRDLYVNLSTRVILCRDLNYLCGN